MVLSEAQLSKIWYMARKTTFRIMYLRLLVEPEERFVNLEAARCFGRGG